MYHGICATVLISMCVFVAASEQIPQYLERGASCTTPYGEQSSCISILSCPGLLSLLLLKNDTATKFAVEFQCGYDTEPLVCCRLIDYPPGTFDGFVRPHSVLDPDIENCFPFEDLPEMKDCGVDKQTNVVLSGEITDFKEFPWLVALQYGNKYTGEDVGVRCGGSIIHKRFILTAAQCILDKQFYISDVWVGDWKNNNTSVDKQVQKLKPIQFIPHPFYSRTSGNNDIGLLKLDSDIEYTAYSQPICLPARHISVPTPETRMVTTGWSTRIRERSASNSRQFVRLLANNLCNRTNHIRPIGPNQICAISHSRTISNQEDPGGLLMRFARDGLDQQSRWYQEGVTSWNYEWENKREPFVYTRVSRYIRWIINVIRRDERKSAGTIY